MIMLLALPVIAAVVLAHRYVVLYAPSNVLIRRVRSSRPAPSTVGAAVAVVVALILAVKVSSDAVAAGAPGWLNFVVLVLAWDAIKWGVLAVGLVLRYAWTAVFRRVSVSIRALPWTSWPVPD